ncbi:hypothetical protein ACFQRK_04015 [Parapedobacter sp. GCM10030251]|uniref:hypothetical protein n=1 Tax=Parapedobacter sp. GCM10030251 TaxID=3273419 RepID=UPI003616333A
MDIVSKFTIASDEGLHNLFVLKEAQIRGMYKDSVKKEQLDKYMKQQLDEKEAINDLNNLSTQMATVYINNTPAGYAIMRQSVSRPEVLTNQKVINYSVFYIMPEHDHDETRNSLWNKCLSVTQRYDAIWIELLQTDPLIPFLESCGFKIQEQSQMKPFDKDSYILIRRRNND